MVSLSFYANIPTPREGFEPDLDPDLLDTIAGVDLDSVERNGTNYLPTRVY